MPIAALVTISGCAKDVVRLDRNRPPRTFMVAAPLDSTGVGGEGSRASYRVHLYWRGEDDDGYVAGFLWAFDDSSLGNFHFTTRTDSIFELVVNDSTLLTGSTTVLGVSKYHTFFIRAIDNLGKPDPGVQFFNRRTFLASTQQPSVEFVGALPSGVGIDTLPDGAPFRICWRGSDPDGRVTRYKFDVGTISSPITTDTCAYFNSSEPGSRRILSESYTFTVTGIDNANAVGRNSFVFVVNHDPETWIEPLGNPVGHYIQYFEEGTRVRKEGTFAPGGTVPYRSTVWWEWGAADTTDGEHTALTDSITGWSVFLNPGTRNDNDPYTIGFVDALSDTVRFKTNNPAVVGPAGFVSLILDSLDAGYGLTLYVRARDASKRADGTPAQFRFNCNYPPKLLDVWVRDTLAVPPGSSTPEPSKAVHWLSYDYEDGLTSTARITINGTQNVDLASREQSYIIPVRIFQSLNPGSTTGGVRVRVGDRAGIQIPSTEALELVFPIP